MATEKPSPLSSSSTKKVQQLPLAPNLVGSIIEKGFSSSSSSAAAAAAKPPNPTVLPFPVARHRSHGGPRSGASVSEEPGFDVDDAAEEENDADYVSVSSFANPIKRKKKKDLDFSRWRELQQVNENKPQMKRAETKSVTKKQVTVPETEIVTKTAVTVSETEIVAKNGEDSRNFAASSVVSSSDAVVSGKREPEISVSNGSEKPTLMDEIEAENLARLSEMSRDEIAEAQAEIMEKMDPGVLEMLKKRARNKLEKKKGLGERVESSKRSKTGALGGESIMTSVSSNNKTWKIWSESVEKVRELRFALDGSVVETGLNHSQLNGKLCI